MAGIGERQQLRRQELAAFPPLLVCRRIIFVVSDTDRDPDVDEMECRKGQRNSMILILTKGPISKYWIIR